jgi:hypothetical protein
MISILVPFPSQNGVNPVILNLPADCEAFVCSSEQHSGLDIRLKSPGALVRIPVQDGRISSQVRSRKNKDCLMPSRMPPLLPRATRRPSSDPNAEVIIRPKGGRNSHGILANYSVSSVVSFYLSSLCFRIGNSLFSLLLYSRLSSFVSYKAALNRRIW